MPWEGNLRKIDDNRWEIPMDENSTMRTNAIIYANESMISQIRSDNAPQQAANVACLPGIVGSSMAMPDIHWGYGFPIGGVAAVDNNDGSISPGGIGFDIIKSLLHTNELNVNTIILSDHNKTGTLQKFYDFFSQINKMCQFCYGLI